MASKEATLTEQRKRTRPVSACENCRRRKIKCMLPAESLVCKGCFQSKKECLFRVEDISSALRERLFPGFASCEVPPLAIPKRKKSRRRKLNDAEKAVACDAETSRKAEEVTKACAGKAKPIFRCFANPSKLVAPASLKVSKSENTEINCVVSLDLKYRKEKSGSQQKREIIRQTSTSLFKDSKKYDEESSPKHKPKHMFSTHTADDGRADNWGSVFCQCHFVEEHRFSEAEISTIPDVVYTDECILKRAELYLQSSDQSTSQSGLSTSVPAGLTSFHEVNDLRLRNGTEATTAKDHTYFQLLDTSNYFKDHIAHTEPDCGQVNCSDFLPEILSGKLSPPNDFAQRISSVPYPTTSNDWPDERLILASQAEGNNSVKQMLELYNSLAVQMSHPLDPNLSCANLKKNPPGGKPLTEFENKMDGNARDSRAVVLPSGSAVRYINDSGCTREEGSSMTLGSRTEFGQIMAVEDAEICSWMSAQNRAIAAFEDPNYEISVDKSELWTPLLG